MVFTQINSLEHKLLLQDEEIQKLKKNNLILENKLNELNQELKQLKKLYNTLIK